MIEFGKKLQNRRVEKKITLEELSKKTRINIIYLKAIEEEDFKNLTETYMRLFMKTYAKYVDIEYPGDSKVFDLQASNFIDDDVIDELNDNKAKKSINSKVKSKKKNILKSENNDNDENNEEFKITLQKFITKYYKLLLIGLIAGLLLVSFYIFFSLKPDSNEAVERENVKIITVNSSEDNSVNVDVRDTVNIISDKTQNLNKVFLKQDSLTFKITVQDSSFILYYTDETQVKEKKIYSKDVVSIKALKNIELKIGKFNILNFTLNGSDKTSILRAETKKNKMVFIKVNKVFGAKIINQSEKINKYLKEKYNYE